MLSFLTSPKKFQGYIGQIQEAAVASWLAVASDAEVLFYGDSELPASLREHPRVRHFPQIECSPLGLPLFDAIARHGAQHARHGVQVYLNADILVPPFFAETLAPALRLERFVVIGQRIDVLEPLAFGMDWMSRLPELARHGQIALHAPTGIDYFVFPRGTWSELPPLVCGRGGYDSALLAHCFRRRIPVVDATRVLPVLHQFHDYAHVPGQRKEVHRGADALFNIRTHDVAHSTPLVSDADFQLTADGMVCNPCRGDRLRRLEIALRYRRRLKYPSYAVRALWRLREQLGWNATCPLKLAELLAGYPQVEAAR